jgi:hypothetical protein
MTIWGEKDCCAGIQNPVRELTDEEAQIVLVAINQLQPIEAPKEMPHTKLGFRGYFLEGESPSFSQYHIRNDSKFIQAFFLDEATTNWTTKWYLDTVGLYATVDAMLNSLDESTIDESYWDTILQID